MTTRMERIAARLLALWPDDFVQVRGSYFGYKDEMQLEHFASANISNTSFYHFQLYGTLDEIEAAITEVEANTQQARLQTVLAAIREARG